MIAKDLLLEELVQLKYTATFKNCSYDETRLDNLERAIAELEELDRLECSGCIHNVDLETLKSLSDEESYAMFEQCSNCSNYYENKYTKAKQ